MTLRRLLVATDGSDNGRRVVSFAIALAKLHESELLLCYAVDHARAIAECSSSGSSSDLLIPLVRELDDAAKSILADARERVSAAGIAVTTDVLEGSAAQAIAEFAERRSVDGIVMGTEAKHGLERFLLGSTADGVLRRTLVPTFVIPPGALDADADVRSVLVGVDDSDPGDAAATFALALARSYGAQLVFCSVAETDVADPAIFGYDPASIVTELETNAAALLAVQTDRATAQHVAFESVVANGDPAEELLNVAQARRAGLIVVGTHGRRGLRRLFVGSVAERVVGRSTVPVVVVRTHPARMQPN